MLLSSTAEYALRAAVWLAHKPGEPQTTTQIAAGTGVPVGYLAKVLRALGRAGLLTSQRGLGGGFVLTRTPAVISVLDVVDAVDPLRRIDRCPLDLVEHRSRLCPLHRRIDDALALVQRSFRKTKIDELAASFSTERTSRKRRRSGRASHRPRGENP